MRIEYQISEDVFVSAAMLAIRKQYSNALFRFLNIRVFGAIIIAIALILCILTRQIAELWPAALLGLILICVPILWTNQFRKQYRKMTMLQRPRSLDIEVAGLHFISQQSDSRTNWELFIY
jgi:Flp pilus assembly protein TadB